MRGLTFLHFYNADALLVLIACSETAVFFNTKVANASLLLFLVFFNRQIPVVFTAVVTCRNCLTESMRFPYLFYASGLAFMT